MGVERISSKIAVTAVVLIVILVVGLTYTTIILSNDLPTRTTTESDDYFRTFPENDTRQLKVGLNYFHDCSIDIGFSADTQLMYQIEVIPDRNSVKATYQDLGGSHLLGLVMQEDIESITLILGSRVPTDIRINDVEEESTYNLDTNITYSNGANLNGSFFVYQVPNGTLRCTITDDVTYSNSSYLTSINIGWRSTYPDFVYLDVDMPEAVGGLLMHYSDSSIFYETTGWQHNLQLGSTRWDYGTESYYGYCLKLFVYATELHAYLQA